MDYLDLITLKTRFTASGRYYSEPVDGAETGAKHFSYEYVNPLSQTYRRLFANVQTEAGEVAIRTADNLGYKTDGIVILQNGKTFRIIQTETDYQAAPKQALRLFGNPSGTQYVMRIIEVQNAWSKQ